MKENFSSTIIQFTIVAAAILFALSYGNNIGPSDLSNHFKENVIIFKGGSHQPLLPQPPME